MGRQIARSQAVHVSRKPHAMVKRSSRSLIKQTLAVCIAALSMFGQGFVDGANAEVLHTYGNSTGHEVVNVIAVSASKLRPLVPSRYTIVPASSLLLGSPDQGIVAIANYQGFNPTVDGMPSSREQVDVDLAIIIAEPAEAANAGVNIPGAFHLYTLKIFSDDARYAASLRSGSIPVEYVQTIGYQRPMDDLTGVGDLTVTVPVQYPSFYSINKGMGYAPVAGAFNGVFWHDEQRGTTVLNSSPNHSSKEVRLARSIPGPTAAWMLC